MDRPDARVARLRSEAPESDLSATLAPCFYIQVVDEENKPLSGAAYFIHQESRRDVGVLDRNGLAFFVTVNEYEPFRFEVQGRVCAIQAGAVLHQVDDPSVQYGGTFFDWGLADDETVADHGSGKTNADQFWEEYALFASGPYKKPEGPMSFWQHDHISRRAIRIRKKYLKEFSARVAVIMAIPVQIRVGPLVRYTSHDTAVLWVELETPGLVRVKVEAMKLQGLSMRPHQIIHHGATIRVGGRYFAAISIPQLTENTRYRYTLELSPLPATGKIPKEGGFTPEVFPYELNPKILANLKKQLQPCSFEDSEWMSFRTLRREYDQHLRFGFGSCRKWANDVKEFPDSPTSDGGPDMLTRTGSWLKSESPENWPRFLIFGGDQIYADDIGAEQAKAIASHRFACKVPGPPSGSDDQNTIVDGAWSGRFAHRFMGISVAQIQKQAPETTKAIESRIAWLTAKIEELSAKQRRLLEEYKRSRAHQTIEQLKANSDERDRYVQEKRQHQGTLKSLDRFFYRYVADNAHVRRMLLRHRLNNHLLWTPPVFKKDIPTVTAYSIHRADHSPYPSVGDDNGIHAADFAEYAFLYEKAWTSDSSVRQVLAHIPTYMIFDDHEITDDWNFSDNWQQIVHNDRDPYRYWPKTMTDGLAAYWIYQGWGNLPPSKWSGEHSDVRARFLTDARDQETDALVKLRPLLLEHSVKPAGEMQWHGGLAWHYELPLSPRFLVMDLRSRRLVKRRSDEFEGRVPLHIMDAEGQSIDPDQLRWMQDRLAQSPLAVAFVVTSTPFLVPPFVSFAQRWPEVLTVIEGAWETEVTRRRRDFEHMVSDKSWDEMRKVMVELHRKQRELKTIVCLSGDVHFSYNMSAHLSTQTHPFPEFVQLVCSAFKNARSPYEKKKLRQFTETLFSDNTYELKGLKVHQGGFADAAYRKRKILPENSVAIVDVHLATMGGQTSSSKQVILREQYLIDQTVPAPPSSRPADPNLPTFLYQTTDSGSIMTQPESE